MHKVATTITVDVGSLILTCLIMEDNYFILILRSLNIIVINYLWDLVAFGAVDNEFH